MAFSSFMIPTVNISMIVNESQYALQGATIKSSLVTGDFVYLLAITGLLLTTLRSSTDLIGISTIVAFLKIGVVYKTIAERISPDAYLYTIISILIQAALVVGKARVDLEDFTGTEVGSKVKSFLKPSLFPCRTTHTRMFPTKHSFSYSYLMVGVPVDWNGSDPMLSTDSATNQNAWFTVQSDDYLARGRHKAGLAGKLRAYLISQNVSPVQFGSAYLITAPRFLGFSFNPISFWYLYDQKNQLSAMILEVNNTFDERRMYFLKRHCETNSEDTFVNEWEKDFHVSPFNDRDGTYSATIRDMAHATDKVSIDNTIVLRSDEGKAKIVARIFSTQPGIGTTLMTTVERLAFIVRWWWVGFMTNPRILREARILWVKKLQVFYRPEVFTTSIGRSESTEETILEDLFRKFLCYIVKDQKYTEILYVPAAGSDNGDVITFKSGTQSTPKDHDYSLSLKVLTPAFYAEIVRTQSLLETFEKFCFRPGPRQAMAITSQTERLQTLLESVTSLQRSKPLSWKEVFVSRLRQQGVWSTLIPCIHSSRHDSLELSQLDMFVKMHCPATTYQGYLSTTLKILLADHLAFGLIPLLKTYFKIARFIYWLILALMVSKTCST